MIIHRIDSFAPPDGFAILRLPLIDGIPTILEHPQVKAGGQDWISRVDTKRR